MDTGPKKAQLLIERFNSSDYHHLKVFEDTLSRIIQELQKIIDNSLIPNQSDFTIMRRMKVLYFLIINKMN